MSIYKLSINSRLLHVAVASVLVLSCSFVSAQQGPEITLNTTELVEDIRATRTVATDVESSLSATVESVLAQTEALKAAGCSPDSTSATCRNMTGTLRDEYLSVLDSVEQKLPALRTAVSKVIRNIEVRMGQQAGTTASDIQAELVQNQSGSTGSSRPAMQGVSGSRLSQSLARLQKLVSTTQGSGVSFRTVQADLYLDMRESLLVLDNLSADIQRTRILAEVQLGDMQVGEEDMQTMQDAQSFIFGDAVTSAPDVPGLPPVPSDPSVNETSPLEL